MPIAAGRRVGRHDLRAQRRGRGHHALAVGPGDEHPELVGQLHQLGLEALALLPCLAVAGRREERGADALLGAGAEQVGVGRRGRAHEDEVDGVVGQVVDVGDHRDAEHVARLAAPAVDRALVAGGEDVVEAHEAELARVGRHAGDEHAPRLEQRLEQPPDRPPSGHLHQGVDRNRPAVDDDQRVQVGAHDGRDRPRRPPTAPGARRPSPRDRGRVRRGPRRGAPGWPGRRSSRWRRAV